MRITVDIEDKWLDQLTEFTGERKKGPAITKAAEEYVKWQMRKDFGKKIREGYFAGTFLPDYDPDKFDTYRKLTAEEMEFLNGKTPRQK